MLRQFVNSLMKIACLLIFVNPECSRVSSQCTERRCLAQMLINKEILVQPQSENCTQIIHVPFIEYQTLSVDMKKLRLNCRLTAKIIWIDPDLAWNESVYPYSAVVLPVDKVWTPELHITNAVTSTMKHDSKDLMVFKNGTVVHNVTIKAQVDCEVNLFKYPFATDDCPVPIQAWSNDKCGMDLRLGKVIMIDGDHGQWRTNHVTIQKEWNSRNYLKVSLSNKFLNVFISLVLPSLLIILVDIASYFMPLNSGERNSFKVTLVLSFIMFLMILTDLLPGDTECSPIIRSHFCACLVLLVLSMISSMLLTRVAENGGLFSCSRSQKSCPEQNEEPENQGDISATEPKVFGGENQQLQKVVRFLEALDAKEKEKERHLDFANKIDRICFWFYLCLCIIYFCFIIYVYTSYPCEVNHFGFWY